MAKFWGKHAGKGQRKGKSRGWASQEKGKGGGWRASYVQTRQSATTDKNEDSKAEPAVQPEMLKSCSWLRGYPDNTGNCLNDYGRGAGVFNPADLAKHLDTNRSEFKRRLSFALSFTSASVNASLPVVMTNGQAFEGGDKNTLGHTLSELRGLYLTSPGKQFRAACAYLDMSKEHDRTAADVRKHAAVFLMFLEKAPKLVPLLQRLMRDVSKLFLLGAWVLEGVACARDMNSWADGFPTDRNLLLKLDPALRKWLRDPERKAWLLDAIVASYGTRAKKAHQQAGNSWDEVPDEEDGDEDEDEENEDGAEGEEEEQEEPEEEDEAWDVPDEEQWGTVTKRSMKRPAAKSEFCDSFWDPEPPQKQRRQKDTNRQDSWEAAFGGSTAPTDEPLQKQKRGKEANVKGWKFEALFNHDDKQKGKLGPAKPKDVRPKTIGKGGKGERNRSEPPPKSVKVLQKIDVSEEESEPEPVKSHAEILHEVQAMAFMHWELGDAQSVGAEAQAMLSSLGVKGSKPKLSTLLNIVSKVPPGALDLYGLTEALTVLGKVGRTVMPRRETTERILKALMQMSEDAEGIFRLQEQAVAGAIGALPAASGVDGAAAGQQPQNPHEEDKKVDEDEDKQDEKADDGA